MLVALCVAGAGLGYVRHDLVRVTKVDFGATYRSASEQVPPVVDVVTRAQHARQVAPSEALDALVAEASAGPVLRSIDDPLLAPARGSYDESTLLILGPDRFDLLALRWNDRDSPGPWRLRRPWLPIGSLALVVAVVAYALLRWRRADEDVVRAKRWVVGLYDISGGLLAAGAGALVSGAMTKGEWLVATLAAPTLLGAIVLLLLGCRASAQRWRRLPDGLLRTGLLRQTFVPYDRVKAYRRGDFPRPPLVPILITLVGLANCVLALIGISLLLRKQPQIHLELADGTRLVDSVEGCEGVDELVKQLEARGIPQSTGAS